MKVVRNECVGCPPEIGCLGDACPYVHVVHHYCDKCGDGAVDVTLYKYDGRELCADCLLEEFEIVDDKDDD